MQHLVKKALSFADGQTILNLSTRGNAVDSMHALKQASQKRVQMCLFSADWCPACRAFEPAWKAAVNDQRNAGSSIDWHNLKDGSPHAQRLAKEYDITSYPTIVRIWQERETKLPPGGRGRLIEFATTGKYTPG